jgi:hypothetical protein
LLSLLLAPAVANAQNPCVTAGDLAAEARFAQSDSGLSGTGRTGSDDSGIGGTGISIAATGADESGIGGSGYTGGDESGLGGTGYTDGDESGIGGTGIFGTITGFGSICVNGFRIRYDDATPIVVDGAPASSEALAIGQVVAVHAAGQGVELDATSVAIHSALTGPITSLDHKAGRLTVMGQRVIAPSDFSRATHGLAVGSRVSVSGLRTSNGDVVATLIAPVAGDRPDSISGIAVAAEGGALTVGGIPIPLPLPQREQAHDGAEFEAGQFIRLTGGWDPERKRLQTSAATTQPLLRPDVARLSIEGYMDSRPGGSEVRMLGFKLDRPSLKRALPRLDRAQRVQVSGRRDSLGRLHVERLEVVDRPSVRPDVKPEIERPRPPEIDKRVRPEVRLDNIRPTRPDLPERPPRITRPKIDRVQKIERVTDRIKISD